MSGIFKKIITFRGSIKGTIFQSYSNIVVDSKCSSVSQGEGCLPSFTNSSWNYNPQYLFVTIRLECKTFIKHVEAILLQTNNRVLQDENKPTMLKGKGGKQQMLSDYSKQIVYWLFVI